MKNLILSYGLMSAILVLATSIFFFGWQLKSAVDVVPQLLEESERYWQPIPTVLTELDRFNAEFERFNVEFTLANKNISEAMDVIEAIDAEIPLHLDRLDDLVSSAGDVAKNASSGAVTGVFKGILATPAELFSQIKGLGGLKKGGDSELTRADWRIIEEQTLHMLASDKLTTVEWENKDTKNSGAVEIESRFDQGQSHCYRLMFTNRIAKTPKGREVLKRQVCVSLDGKVTIKKT